MKNLTSGIFIIVILAVAATGFMGCGSNHNAKLYAIQVSPANQSIGIGGTQQFTATGVYTDDSMEDLTSSATWSSSDSLVSTISSTQGLATGIKAGSTTITAVDPTTNISGSTVLTVQ